jgi:hypothetical protein
MVLEVPCGIQYYQQFLKQVYSLYIVSFMVHMDELLNLDEFPDLFNDNSLSDIESLLQFDAYQLGFLDIDQWGMP